MSGCSTCPAEKVCNAEYRGSRCRATRSNYGLFTDPQTNADRIRAMTDEELAEFMDERNACLRSHLRTAEDCEEYHDCKDCWLDWLKQEAIT